MRRVYEVIKKEITEKVWTSEYDLMEIITGITTVNHGREYFHINTGDYKLSIQTKGPIGNRTCGSPKIEIRFVDYDGLEERKFVVSSELYDRFSEKIKKVVEDTEEERFIKKYARKYGININIDKK